MLYPLVRVGVGALICVMLVARGASAQGTGAITGVARDATGAVLPGVSIEASSPVLIEKVRVAVTDDQGLYRITSLIPGTYVVTFTLPGFATVRREGIELTSNFTATVDAELRVGGLEESITVSGQSPIVDTRNAVQQRVISRETLNALPMTREFTGFAAITLGANIAPTVQDVGGNKDPISAYMSVHGSRSRDTRQLIDGMNFNGEGSGRGFYFNPAAASEMVMEVGGASAEKELGGPQANLIPREGGNAFSAYFFANYTNKDLTSDNLTSEIQARGLRTVNATDRLYDVNVAIGGPIKRDKLWFFTHHRLWGYKNPLAGNFFNSTPGTLVYTPDESRPAYKDQQNLNQGIRFTWQASRRNKINVGFDIQRNCLCYNGMTALNSPEAGWETYYGHPNTFSQIKWNFPATSRVLLEAGSSTLLFNWPNYRHPEAFGGIRITDQVRNFTWGAPPISSLGIRIADQTNARAAVSYVTGSHLFKTGFTMELGFHDHKWDEYGTGGTNPFPALPMDYVFRSGVPTALTLYATPVQFRERLSPNLGIFAQDQWTIRRVTLNYGLRFDYFNGYVPEQHLAAGPFVAARDFAKVDCVPCWNDIEPRLGVVWDLFGTGKTALKGNVGRYVDADRYQVIRENNPVQTSVNVSSRVWNDLNGNFVPDCDLASPTANAECGQIANLNFGRANPLAATWASDVLDGWGVRPYSWQGSLTIQHELRPGLAIHAGYFRTWFGNWRAIENVALTPADFDAFTFVAPADPRLPGGGGYPVPGLYDVKPERFGQSRTVVSQSSNYGEQSEVYNGFDFAVNARHPRGMLNGGVNIGRQILNDCSTLIGRPQMTPVVTNDIVLFTSLFVPSRTGIPYSEAFCDGHQPWQPQWKFQGTYALPWSFQAAFTYQNLPGIPQLAIMPATSAQIAPYLGRDLAAGARGTMNIQLIAPYSQFEDRITQLDVRGSRIFRVGHTRLEALIDLYNVLNSSSILSINTTYGPAWSTPTEVLAGRLLKFGVQIDF